MAILAPFESKFHRFTQHSLFVQISQKFDSEYSKVFINRATSQIFHFLPNFFKILKNAKKKFACIFSSKSLRNPMRDKNSTFLTSKVRKFLFALQQSIFNIFVWIRVQSLSTSFKEFIFLIVCLFTTIFMPILWFK